MTRPIKHILLLSSWYPNKNAPFLGNFVQEQARLLAQKYQVTVIHTVADADLKEVSEEVHQHGNLTEMIVYHPKGKTIFARKKNQEQAFDRALSEVEHVDVIHAHVLLPKGHLFLHAKKNFDCPLVVIEHSSIYRQTKPNLLSLKDKFILKLVKKHIDRLVAVSAFLKKDLSNYFPNREISVIGNSVDTQKFTIREKQPHTKVSFLHVSTLDPAVKNPKGIIDAVSLLQQKGYTDFVLNIVSDEPYQELQQYAEAQQVAELITFSGPIEHDEIVRYFQLADAFVLFSAYETFSIVLAEAWSCGIPTITTPVGIAADMPEENGRIVKIGDTLSMAMGMEELLLKTKQYDPETIRKHALQFAAENILQQWDALHSEL